MLAGIVCADPRRAGKSGDTRAVDDAASSGRLHRRDHVFEAKKRADNVDVDDAPEISERVLGDRTHRTLDAGVVEKDLDATGLALCVSNVSAHRVFVGDIGFTGYQVEVWQR